MSPAFLYILNIFLSPTLPKFPFFHNCHATPKGHGLPPPPKFWTCTLIQPHFDYACTAWYPLLNKRQSKRIQIAQNKCIKYCLNLDNKAHIGTNEFLKINWLPTKKRVEQCICANVFKFFNQMSPQYTAEIFHPSSSVHNTRRATQKLDLPFRKSCIGQKTLSYIGPKIWNYLPAQIKLSISVNTFKHDIKKSFFDDLQKQNDDIFFYY